MTSKRLFSATLVVLLGWTFASAQGLGRDAGGPVVGEPTVGETITPEEMERFIAEARQRRLSLERKQVAAEIQQGLVIDPSKIDAAVKDLSQGARNTSADNAERICRAFSLVDRRFGKAWALLQSGNNKDAAQAFKPLISTRDTSYLAAAKRFCYAEALAGMGRNEDAVDAYTDLVKAMPDRFSFSSLALLKAGRTYERMHRRYYAMTLYNLWVESFGLLDTETAKELAKRADEIAADYNDPLGTLSGKMSTVADRLAAVDSGRGTQEKQKEIIAMLDDLIATAEECCSGSGQAQGKCSKCGKAGCQGECQGGGKGSGEGSGKGSGKGSGSGPASGIGIPSSPATVSRLVTGATVRPSGLSEVRPSDGSDDWGKMAPRQREKLLETFKETMPERYREMIRDYYKRLASNEG